MTIKKIGNLIFYFLKKNVFVFVIFLFFTTSASASILSDAANSLSAGESIKITTNNLKTVAINNGDTVTMWGNTGVWCPIRKRAIWIGKRHSPNPYKRIEYDEATNTWTSESLPSALTSDRSGHGYDHDAIDPSTGNIYFKSNYDNVVHKWTRSSDKWSTIDAIPGSTQCCETLEWWAGRGLVYSDDYGVRLWNESSWSTIISNGLISSIGYHSFGEYQSNADMYVFGGGNADSKRIYRLTSNDKLSLLGSASIGLGNSTSGQGILVNDPGSDYFIAWDEINTWYQFDPINDQWGSLSECSGDGSVACTGTPNFSDEGYAIAIAISDYDVIMFLSHRSNDVWLYKHANSSWTPDTTEPTITAFDIASTSSSYQVAVNSFVATDDNGVSGYYIGESATKPLATDSGWTTTPPSSYQASTSGTVTLYAWAKDYAGNISSSIVSDSVQITIADGDVDPGAVQSFRITSTTTGTAIPFTAGLAFKKGDVFGAPTLDLSDYQVVVKRRWNDNSVKHAIISGRYTSTADTPTTVTVYDSGIQPYGTDLDESDIVAAAPTASIALSGIGTVTLANLLGSPDRTFISGPEMVEAHYSADFSDSDMVAKFHVRLYADDSIWIRAIVENGILDGSTTGTKSYTPTVIIGGRTVYNSAVTHYGNTRWCVEGWIGITDPETTIDHDCAYLETTKLVPNYWKKSPSASALNGLDQTYTPMHRSGYTQNMSSTGYQNQIGLLPLWDALYISSDGDNRAFNAVVTHAKAINSYAIIWRDPSTDDPITISSWPTWTLTGAGSGGTDSVFAGSLQWEINHHPSVGYLAYLITGDYYYLETMLYQGALLYLCVNSNRGSGTDRALHHDSTRGDWWILRSYSQIAGIVPTGNAIGDDMRGVLSSTIDYWKAEATQDGINGIGWLTAYELGTATYGTDGEMAPWQHHFGIAAFGYGYDLEPLSNMTNWQTARDFVYKAIVGILGPNGASYYCFTKATKYTINIASTDTTDPTNWWDTWGDVYTDTFGVDNTSCGNTLEGDSGGHPTAASSGYWGNLLPAIAYAVDDGATGASDAWARLTGSTNWSTVENSGFDDRPIWGIVPRSHDPGIVPDAPTPPGNLRILD